MSSSTPDRNTTSATQYLRFVNDLVDRLVEIDVLEDTLDYISGSDFPLFCGDVCAVYLADDGMEQLALSALSSAPTSDLQFSEDTLEHSDIVSMAWQGKEALVQELSVAAKERESCVHRVQMEVAAPILFRGDAVGVIYLASGQAGFFQQEHLELAKTLALIFSAKIGSNHTVSQLRQSVRKLEHAEKLQTALYEISSVTHDAKDLKELYKRIHSIVGRLIYAKNFYIALVDTGAQIITFPFFVDEKDPEYEDQSYVFKQDEDKSLTGYLLTSKEPLLTLPSNFDDICHTKGIQLVGSKPSSWLGAPFFLDHLSGAVVVQSYDDEVYFTEKDKELLVFVAGHVGDALEHKRSEQRLHHLALHDPLTGLPNRMLFYDRLSMALARHQREPEHHVAIFFLDLDLFKSVNDSYGHLIGDELLKQTSLAIGTCLRESDTLARFGGDEFAILLEDLSRDEASQIAERIILAMQQVFEIEGHRINTSASIGIAFANPQITRPDEMVGMADRAMYQVKARKPSGYMILNE